MSLFRRSRTEVAGAWRSLRYDLSRRPDVPPASAPTASGTTVDGAEVTSTGMNTFGAGLPLAGDGDDGYGPDELPPVTRSGRRATAVAAFGALALVGAVGTYFGVVNGLGALLAEKPAAATVLPSTGTGTGTGTGASRTVKQAEKGQTGGNVDEGQAGGEAGTGGTRGGATNPSAVSTAGATVLHPKGGASPRPSRNPPRRSTPNKTIKPTKSSCRCGVPPVPTPTAPTSPESPSASVSPSAGEAPASSGESPAPSDSADISGDSHETRWRLRDRHHRHNAQ